MSLLKSPYVINLRVLKGNQKDLASQSLQWQRILDADSRIAGNTDKKII
jgi:hypothetical protein